MEIVRKFLGEEEIDGANTRYNPDCDCVETRASPTSPWVPDPTSDPRYGAKFRLQPREGSNVRCDAAEAMMQHFKAQVDAFLTSLSILQFVNSVLTLAALFIPGLGLLSKAIFVVAEALITIGASVIDAAMTEEVYDEIKCIIFNNIGEDGQMSAGQLAAIQTEIDTEIGGTPNLVFDLFAGMWGEVGWSNAGAVGEYTGDCEDCPSGWVKLYDFRIDPYQFVILDDQGVWVDGVGFQSTFFSVEDIGIRDVVAVTDDFDCLLTGVKLGFVYEAGLLEAGAGNVSLQVADRTFTHVYFQWLLPDVPPSSPQCWTTEGAPEVNPTMQLSSITGFTTDASDPGGTATLVYLLVRGVGDPPPGGVDAEWEDC